MLMCCRLLFNKFKTWIFKLFLGNNNRIIQLCFSDKNSDDGLFTVASNSSNLVLGIVTKPSLVALESISSLVGSLINFACL